MSLQDWLNEGKLRTHKTSKNEIDQLMAVFERDISDAQVKGLSADRRFAVAYNAALMMAVAALAACGYRAATEGHHYWTIQSLTFTLQLDTQTIEKFNKFRQKRNISDYDRTGMVSEREVSEVLDFSKSLRTGVTVWLKQNYPELIV
jgi:hypothetical protein